MDSVVRAVAVVFQIGALLFSLALTASFYSSDGIGAAALMLLLGTPIVFFLARFLWMVLLMPVFIFTSAPIPPSYRLRRG